MSIIGITMGCPASVGPEIILKYYSSFLRETDKIPVVLGDLDLLARCGDELGITARIVSWQPGNVTEPNTIPVLQLSNLTGIEWGKPTLATGTAMAEYITKGVELAQQGAIDGIVTCPIAKDSLQAAGFNYPGHTEMLAELTSAANFTMMMAGPTLKVTLATIHCRFSDVPEKLTENEILRIITLTHASLVNDFGMTRPRVAVAGLNPHSGESGLFGDEEMKTIRPAIEKSIDMGMDVSGPHPPDTVFFNAAAGKYDCVVCMYHDQGLIPFKLLHFKDGVNVTLGLPIVRTSVDHGTAYDIAGKGLADATSLAEAVTMAQQISTNRNLINQGPA